MKICKHVVLVATLSLVTLAGAGPAVAQPNECLVGPSLAATLLYPYFEVDLDDPAGFSTLISINNGTGGPALARVVLWTDFGIPVLAFDVYLDPFDVQTINLRSVLEGTIPSTGDGVDLSGFEFCDFLAPSHANPVLTSNEAAQLRSDLTGVQGPLFLDCTGAAYGDNRARGYITVDMVDECSGVESGDPFFTPALTDPDIPYFDDGGGSFIATNENRLWGDIVYVDFTGAAAQGSEAVAVRADEATFSGPDQFTFYGRFSDWDGRDHRVPLPYLWDQRFLNGGPFAGGADLTVWRDPGELVIPADCGTLPAPYPLNDETAILDEESNLVFTASDENYPYATQRVSIDDLGAIFDFGWIQVETIPASSAWVQPTLKASGLFSASLNGIPVAFLCGMDPTP